MTHALTIDRFEGEGKEIAVLLDERDRTIAVPRDLLPRGAKAGEILKVRIDRDKAATARLAADTREVQQELDRTDPGGDIKL